MQIQDMLLEAVNFALVTRNGQKRLPSLTCSVLGDFCRTVWVDPTTLGTNDHHGHLEGSLGYPRPPTLPQNSIGSLRGDVRPDLCQSGLSSSRVCLVPFGSVQRKTAQT
ncbi:hypothetical protein CRG98_028524 [Punica granatum]|uniref:Uncharacterized protein n=1 Tax=Punica granatum TaxID=22663 RepID=A0A2I0J4E5_PUNGR|nr:hypothetical protein CRG98_028524 [Punica granatum]